VLAFADMESLQAVKATVAKTIPIELRLRYIRESPPVESPPARARLVGAAV